mgnify:CR=1 FL=1
MTGFLLPMCCIIITNMNTPTSKKDNAVLDKKTSPLSHPWEKYLPSKRIRIVLIVIIVLLVLYGLKNPATRLFQKIFVKATDTLVTIPTPQVEKPSTILSTDKDSDGDGLADWQEVLIGTDPNIANSQAEIPDSVRDLVVNTTKGVITTEDKLALNVYHRLQTDPKGTNITEAIQAATTKEILDLADSLDEQLTTYTYDDLDIVDDDNSSRTTYKNSINSFNTSLRLNDSLVKDIYNAMFTGERSVSISTFQVSLKQATIRLLAMPVPLRLADQHLTLVNAIVHINEILGSKEASSSDGSILYASFLVFQKNFNLATQMTDSIIQLLK